MTRTFLVWVCRAHRLPLSWGAEGPRAVGAAAREARAAAGGGAAVALSARLALSTFQPLGGPQSPPLVARGHPSPQLGQHCLCPPVRRLRLLQGQAPHSRLGGGKATLARTPALCSEGGSEGGTAARHAQSLPSAVRDPHSLSQDSGHWSGALSAPAQPCLEVKGGGHRPGCGEGPRTRGGLTCVGRTGASWSPGPAAGGGGGGAGAGAQLLW